MIKYRITPVLATLLMLLIANPIKAEKHHESESHDDHKDGSAESLEAHVHGAAELFVVLDGQELEIELHSPAANLLGFEHEARNAEEKEQVENLKQTLANADNLFKIGSGACELNNQELDLGNLAIDDSAHDDEAHHDEKHEDEEHGNEHHEDGDHDEEAHSDIEAQYRYSCKQADKIRSLETSITSEFPSIESLEVQWIVNGRQGAAVLKNSQREVVFK